MFIDSFGVCEENEMIAQPGCKKTRVAKQPDATLFILYLGIGLTRAEKFWCGF